MKTRDHLVLVLDDDQSVVTGLKRLLSAHGYRVLAYLAPEDFFRNGNPPVPSCLILDVNLADGETGMQVYDEMRRRGWEIPTVFLTARQDVRSAVTAMRAGADGYLTKPIEPPALLEAVEQALSTANRIMQEASLADEARRKAALLTGREKDIVRLVAEGKLNKEIAAQLELALVTVKLHRGRAMSKLKAGNAVELARIARLAGLLE